MNGLRRKPAPTVEKISWRNRIKEIKLLPASAVDANPRNWRTHSDDQRAAFRAIMDQVGFAGVELAYHSKRNGGRLTLIDGHMRKEEVPADFQMHVAITDLNDEEADALLATFDPLGNMAGIDDDKLAALLKDIDLHALDGLAPLLDKLETDAGIAEKPKPKMKKIDTTRPPKMAWVLIGIPTTRFGEIAESIESIGQRKGVICETTVNDNTGES